MSSKSRKSDRNADRRPTDGKRDPRAKSRTITRKQARAAKRAWQGR